MEKNMYSEIIKEIRKAKGFTQKEVYIGVVSKTFYSDFEAGKYSVEISKFQGFLNNLGITYEEFEFFKNRRQPNQEAVLERQIDELYKNGKFEELYAIYEEYNQNPNVEMRYLSTKAYLLVLITNTNFYKFSRAPFGEIFSELECAKMWTLKEIKLGKLILLSLSEKDKKKAEELYKRIVAELEKYKDFDRALYYEEMGDLDFNRIQSLLVLNDIEQAQQTLDSYSGRMNQSDNLYLLIQVKFISHLVNLYQDFLKYQVKMEHLLKQLHVVPTSETNFYNIIYQVHKEKARNYFERYVK